MDPKELKAQIDAAAKKAADEAAERTRVELEAKFKAENDEREKRYAKERAADAARLAALEAQRASEAIETSVKRCTIPALHPHLRVFATLAFAQTGDAAAKKYALGEGADKKPVEATAREAFDALVGEINTKGARLFSVVSKSGERKTEGEYADRGAVNEEIERRVKELKAKDAKLTTAQAQDQVFAADAELAKAYTEVNRPKAA